MRGVGPWPGGEGGGRGGGGEPSRCVQGDRIRPVGDTLAKCPSRNGLVGTERLSPKIPEPGGPGGRGRWPVRGRGGGDPDRRHRDSGRTSPEPGETRQGAMWITLRPGSRPPGSGAAAGPDPGSGASRPATVPTVWQGCAILPGSDGPADGAPDARNPGAVWRRGCPRRPGKRWPSCRLPPRQRPRSRARTNNRPRRP